MLIDPSSCRRPPPDRIGQHAPERVDVDRRVHFGGGAFCLVVMLV